MADIVMADDGIAFDSEVMRQRPLGGAETALTSLAEALAARGNTVTVCNNCANPGVHEGVAWRRIADGLPGRADLYIANRGDRLILAMGRRARRTVFWIHNPARYLMKLRYLWKLAWKRPAIVFSGPSHVATYPHWAPGERVVIPYGIADLFRHAQPAGEPPPPRAIFTSNPMRGLAWLLELWASRIHPGMPTAELHVFSGPSTYGAAGRAKAAAMQAVLERARHLSNCGVVLREPVAKSVLVDELRQARVMLYRGDPGETFCLAVGEAQAVGVPAVVQPIGATPERVVDGITGHVATDDNEFAAAAVRLLADDSLWRMEHRAALERQRAWGWDDAAAAFERLIP
ncbi:MAG: glycosyltransferase [Alphaproteobacteria bacterium]|nr:glycosyltransferase [Alphaproteobacteria bacterium]